VAQFKAFAPDIEVNGQTVLSVVKGCSMQSIARQYLRINGIDDPQPQHWYPQQAWLDTFQQISAVIGDMGLMLIGQKIPDSADWPADVRDIAGALASIDVAYHMNHRRHGRLLYDTASGAMDEGIGHYQLQQVDERSSKVICCNPYPCDFDRGIVGAAANKFKPAGFRVMVSHEHVVPCRKKGGDTCVYLVSWKPAEE